MPSKTLTTLIRMHKNQLDELRTELTSLENQKAQLYALIETLIKQLEDELQLAETMPEMAHFFGEFSSRIKKRQEDIRDEIYNLDRQMDALSEEISEAFSEMKKFEITHDLQVQEEEKALVRQEQIELDDIAVDQFLRKETNI